MTIARGNSVAPLHLISATFPRSGRDTTACDRCDDGIDRRERDFPRVCQREKGNGDQEEMANGENIITN